MLKNIFKNKIFTTMLGILLFLLIVYSARFIFTKLNIELINKIEKLQEKIAERDVNVELLKKEIENKKVEIVEKEKIVYREGKLIIPEDYNDLKNNYVEVASMYEMQKEIIFKLEEKSSSDDQLIRELSSALDESKKEILKLSQKELLSSSIIAGSDLESVDISYQVLFFEKVYAGIGFSTNLKAKFYVGIKL